MDKKGQASLEYLTTYAWAFIVIVVTIGAFVYFGVLNPSKTLPTRCTFSPEIQCIDSSTSETGFTLSLKSNIPDPMYIESVTVATQTKDMTCTPTIAGSAPNTVPWNVEDRNSVDFACDLAAAGITAGKSEKLALQLKYYKAKSGPQFTNVVNGELLTTFDFDTLSQTGTCGDNDVNQVSEQCDGADLNSQTCTSQGQGTGTLGCTAGCQFDYTNCVPAGPECGDNVVNQGSEQCDGSDLDGEDCASQDQGTGTLGCTGACQFDYSGCTIPATFCGDNVVQTPNDDGFDEECDTTSTMSCSDFSGWTGAGTVDCTSCTWNEEEVCSVLNPMEVLHFTFDDGTATDTSGNSNTGQINGVDCSVTTPFGQGCDFSGASNYIEIPNSADFNFANQLTLSFWVKPPASSTGDNYILMKGLGTTYRVYHNNYERMNFMLTYDDAISSSSTTASNTFPYNEWNHYTLVFDGSTIKQYLNGFEVYSFSKTGNLEVNSDPLIIGAQKSAAGAISLEFEGIIDEVRIWNYALTQTEIDEVADPYVPKLVAYYSFDDGTATDTTGNLHDGTLYGGLNCNAAGKVGTGCDFVSNLNSIEILDHSDLAIGNEMSFMAWIYPDSSASVNFISKGALDLRDDYYVHYASSGFSFGALVDSLDGYSGGVSTTDGSQGAWNHVAVVYKDGVSSEIYIDGTLSNSAVAATGIRNSNLALTLGGRANDLTNFLDGRLDEVKIYNYAITPTEIQTEYQRGATPQELIAHYSFNNNHPADDSGNGLDGTKFGFTSCSAQGIDGIGCEFDGIDDYVRITANPKLSTPDQLTLSFWVKNLGGNTGSNAILQKGYQNPSNPDDYWVKYEDTPNRILAHIKTGGIGSGLYSADNSLPLDTWTHHVMTYDGATLKLYYNGVLQSTQPRTGLVPNTGDLVFGTRFDDTGPDSNYYWKGVLDEVKLWNYVLTDSEILTEFQSVGTFCGDGAVQTPNDDGQTEECDTATTKTCSEFSGWTGAATVECLSCDWNYENVCTPTEPPTPSGGTVLPTVQYYSFDDGTALDHSGNDHDGIQFNGVDCTVPGKFGTGCRFDGIDDYIFIPKRTSSMLTGTKATVMAWVKNEGTTSTSTIISRNSKNNVNSYDYFMSYSNAQRFIGGFLAGGLAISSIEVDGNPWVHIAIVRDGSLFKVYKNGVQAFINRNTAYTNTIFSNQNPQTSIGARTLGVDTPSNFFKGIVDEVKVFHEGLTGAQIVAEMNVPDDGSSPFQRPQPVAGYTIEPDAYYSFDNQKATDDSGKGNSGDLMFGADCTQPGVYGKACLLDGVDDYINIIYNPKLKPTTSFTAMGWVKFLSTNTDQDVIFVNGGQTTDAYRAYYTPTDKIVFKTKDESNSNQYIFSGSDFIPNVWHHLAITYDGSYKYVYLNGEQIKSATETGALRLDSLGIGIGAEAGSPNSNEPMAVRPFKGMFDEVKFYNQALTQEQIKTEMNPSLIAHYSFDDGTADDISGNNNDGTKNGGLDCSVPGRIGTACSFDGVDDFVKILQSQSLDTPEEVTISFWVKPAAGNTHSDKMIHKGPISPYDYQVWYNDATNINTASFFVGGSGATAASNLLPDNT